MYEEEIKAMFVSYISENYRSPKLLLTWKEVALQNKKLTSYALIQFLKEAQIVPIIMNIEPFEDIMMKMVPQVHQKENEFYHRHRLVHIYEKELDQAEQKIEGDPRVSFHEFQLLLGRIAFECYPKDQEKKDMEDVMKRFFKKILQVRNNQEIETEDFPNINKKLYTKLRNYYRDVKEEEEEEESEGEESEEEDDFHDPMQILAEQQKNQIFNAQPPTNLEIGEILSILKRDLPQMPDEIKPNQENPPPYKMVPAEGGGKKKKKKKKKKKGPELAQEKVVIGDQLPDKPKEKNAQQKAKAPKAKNQLKRGEKPPKKIIFAGYPPPPSKMTYNYLEELNHELTFGDKNLTEVERGSMSDIDVIPVIVEEIIYPPEVPQEVVHLIESAISHYNQQNYLLSIEHFDKAKAQWQKVEEGELPDNINLFFEYSKSSIYSSAGRDDYALVGYMTCKIISDKLQYTQPDRALAYCGIGSTLFNIEEYTLATRSFLKAR